MEYFLVNLRNGIELEVEAEYDLFEADLDGPAQAEINVLRVFKKDEYGDYHQYEPELDEDLEIQEEVAAQILEDNQGEMYD